MKKTFVLFLLATALLPAAAYESNISRGVDRAAANATIRRDQALLDAVENPNQLSAVRRLLEQGANPCRALPFALGANNAPAIKELARYGHTCNWKNAVEQRLQQVMQKDKVDVFYALMENNQNISCPDPFNFTPSPTGGQWHPVSARMLSAVNQRCFTSNRERANFLKDIIFLNPQQRTIFALGESYHYGIPNSSVQRTWLATIGQLIKARVKISNDTLRNVVTQSRVPSAYGAANLPLDTTRVLIKLCLQGGADGKTVLQWLDSNPGNWVWKNYSAQERMRISNLLEGKPEMQPRSLLDRLRGF